MYPEYVGILSTDCFGVIGIFTIGRDVKKQIVIPRIDGRAQVLRLGPVSLGIIESP